MASVIDRWNLTGLRRRSILDDGTTRNDNAIVMMYSMTDRTLDVAQVHDDDYILLTEPPTEAPAIHHHDGSGNRNPTEVFLDVSVILIWCCVAIVSVYYCLTEHQRRRRMLRRQRQERLEQFSPCKQAKRKMQLTQILMETTMLVKSEYLVSSGNDNRNETSKIYSPVPCVLKDDDGSFRDVKIMSVGEDEMKGSGPDSSPSVNALDQGEIFPSPDDDNMVEVVEESDVEDGEIQRLCQIEPDSKDLSSSSSWQSDDTDTGDDRILRIPRGVHSTVVEVPARCVICLKRYRVNDLVSWSPNNNNLVDCGKDQQQASIIQGCHHAFHQHCIVEWLAILPDCNCPICRKVFCKLESTAMVNKTITV